LFTSGSVSVKLSVRLRIPEETAVAVIPLLVSALIGYQAPNMLACQENLTNKLGVQSKNLDKNTLITQTTRYYLVNSRKTLEILKMREH